MNKIISSPQKRDQNTTARCPECGSIRDYGYSYAEIHTPVGYETFLDVNKIRHIHDPATIHYYYTCKNQHRWTCVEGFACPACEWKAEEVDEPR